MSYARTTRTKLLMSQFVQYKIANPIQSQKFHHLQLLRKKQHQSLDKIFHSLKKKKSLLQNYQHQFQTISIFIKQKIISINTLLHQLSNQKLFYDNSIKLLLTKIQQNNINKLQHNKIKQLQQIQLHSKIQSNNNYLILYTNQKYQNIKQFHIIQHSLLNTIQSKSHLVNTIKQKYQYLKIKTKNIQQLKQKINTLTQKCKNHQQSLHKLKLKQQKEKIIRQRQQNKNCQQKKLIIINFIQQVNNILQSIQISQQHLKIITQKKSEIAIKTAQLSLLSQKQQDIHKIQQSMLSINNNNQMNINPQLLQQQQLKLIQLKNSLQQLKKQQQLANNQQNLLNQQEKIKQQQIQSLLFKISIKNQFINKF